MSAQIVAMAADHAGFKLKEAMKTVVAELGFEVLDLGTDSSESVDYPDYGNLAAEAVLDGKASRGIIICGSGVGISIAANRHAGIRSALCTNGLAARLARQHNDANMLALGARLVGEAVAADCVKEFLTTEFEGGRHQRRVEKLG